MYVCMYVCMYACMCIYLRNLILLCCWVFSNVFIIEPIIEPEKLLIHGSMV